MGKQMKLGLGTDTGLPGRGGIEQTIQQAADLGYDSMWVP